MGDTNNWIISDGTLFGCTGQDENAVVPYNVNVIFNNAFVERHFKSLSLSFNVKEIKDYAFFNTFVDNLILSNKGKALDLLKQLFSETNNVSSIKKITFTCSDPCSKNAKFEVMREISQIVGQTIPIEFKLSMASSMVKRRLLIKDADDVDAGLFIDTINELCIDNSEGQLFDIVKRIKELGISNWQKICVNTPLTDKEIWDVYLILGELLPMECNGLKVAILGKKYDLDCVGETVFIDASSSNAIFLIKKTLKNNKDAFINTKRLVIRGDYLTLGESDNIYELLGHPVTIVNEIKGEEKKKRKLFVDPTVEILDNNYYNAWELNDVVLTQNLDTLRGLENNFINILDLPCSTIRIEEDFLANSPLESLSFTDRITSVGDGACKGTHIKELCILAYNGRIKETLELFLKATPDIFDDLEHLAILGSSLSEEEIAAIKMVVGENVDVEYQVSLDDDLLNQDDEEFLIIDGILIEYRDTKKDVIIPYGVLEILPGVFEGKELNSVSFPSTVEVIGKRAFANNNLTDVVLPYSIKIVYNQAFNGNKLEELTISDNLLLYSYNIISLDDAKLLKGLYINNFESGKLLNFLKLLFMTYSFDSLEKLIIGGKKLSEQEEIALHEILLANNVNGDIFQYSEAYNVDVLDVNSESKQKLNINNSNWKIVNNRLIRYLGSESNVIIPDGVVAIGKEAFRDTKVMNAKFPSTLKTIEARALASNNIERAIIPDSVEQIRERAFADNPLNYLSISTNTISFNDDSDLKSFDLDFVTTICIRNYDGNAYQLLAKLCNNQSLSCLEKVVITGKKLSFVENLKIKKFLKMVKKDVSLVYQKNVQELEEDFPLFQDEEINTLVWTINEVIDMLHFEDRDVVQNRIKELLNKYVENLKALEPHLDFETDFSLCLLADPKTIRISLIAELESIINHLNNHSLYSDILVKIAQFKELLNDKEVNEMPSKIVELEDLVKSIMVIANMRENTEIKQRLEKILKDNESLASRLLANCLNLEPNLMNDYVDVEVSLKESLQSLYNDALVYNQVLDSFDGKDKSELAEHIKLFRDLTFSLDDEHRAVFIENLNKMRDSISLSLVAGSSYDEIVLMIRESLQSVMESFSDVEKRIAQYRNVLNDMNGALALLECDTNNPNMGIIESTVSEILTILNNGSFPGDKRLMSFNKLQEVLESWKKRLLSDSDGKKLVAAIRGSENAKDSKFYVCKFNDEHIKGRWFMDIKGAAWMNSEDDSLLITMSILSDVMAIKTFISNYATRKVDYDALLRTLSKTMANTSDNE
ncbi:MAG: leucine-rich repeat domain-containing protein [Bacilli bacterium]|jgi:hypothetical protein|nr:leucine-rich repeat domain-containing protein [Bacilli bacterium]